MILNIRSVCVQKFIFSYNYFSCKTNCWYYWAISSQNPQATCFVVVTFSYTFFLDSNKNNKIGFSARKSCSFNHRVTKQSKVSSLEKVSYSNIVEFIAFFVILIMYYFCQMPKVLNTDHILLTFWCYHSVFIFRYFGNCQPIKPFKGTDLQSLWIR